MEKYDSEIFKISKDEERAKDLLDMAKERMEFAIKYVPKDMSYRLLQEYYEVAVQLMTSIMYADGYKTLSHISLIEYLKSYNELNNHELEMLDRMRKARHGTVYYGRKDGGNFFLNHENEIKILINKLDVKRIKVIFDWKDLQLPKELLLILKKSGTIWNHDGIAVKINKEWIKVDCTWNLELKSKGFPVTEYWDGKSDTLQVTKGKLQFYDSDKFESKIKVDKEEAHKFADELNKWLAP